MKCKHNAILYKRPIRHQISDWSDVNWNQLQHWTLNVRKYLVKHAPGENYTRKHLPNMVRYFDSCEVALSVVNSFGIQLAVKQFYSVRDRGILLRHVETIQLDEKAFLRHMFTVYLAWWRFELRFSVCKKINVYYSVSSSFWKYQ